jgi:hypothetical protein
MCFKINNFFNSLQILQAEPIVQYFLKYSTNGGGRVGVGTNHRRWDYKDTNP